MRITITGPFATAKDTARILGVSDKRLKELLRLRSSGRLFRAKKERLGFRFGKRRKQGFENEKQNQRKQAQNVRTAQEARSWQECKSPRLKFS